MNRSLQILLIIVGTQIKTQLRYASPLTLYLEMLSWAQRFNRVVTSKMTQKWILRLAVLRIPVLLSSSSSSSSFIDNWESYILSSCVM